MNSPRVVKVLRKTGLFVAGLAKYFLSEEYAEMDVEKIYEGIMQSGDYDHYTDRQVGKLALRVLDYPTDTREFWLIDTIVGRLLRSPAGMIHYGEDGHPRFNYVPIIRLIPAGVERCDSCGAMDRPVDESMHNCLWCLALKYSVEVRRDKLATTLRVSTANIAKIVREKLREFQKPLNSPEPPKAD